MILKCLKIKEQIIMIFLYQKSIHLSINKFMYPWTLNKDNDWFISLFTEENVAVI